MATAAQLRPVHRLFLRSLRKGAWAFVPTVVRKHFSNEISKSATLRSTAYLDGARGFAAVIVLNYHFFYAFSDLAEMPWDYSKNPNPLLMPIVRIWVSGGSSLPLFFIFGGYAIALKPLKLMQSDGPDALSSLLAVLSSSAFRRFFRLYLPVFSMTLIVAIMVYLGAYEPTRSRLASPLSDLSRMHEKHLEPSASFSGQILRWQDEMLRSTGAWDWKNYGTDHDKHLWTILTEFRCSMVLYVSLLATAQLRPWCRMATVLALSLHSMYWFRTDMVNFYWGVALAQLDVILTSASPRYCFSIHAAQPANFDVEKSSLPSIPPLLKKGMRDFGLSILFLFSFWCMSAPLWEWNTAFGYSTLASLVPSHFGTRDKFVPALGVIALQRCLYSSSPDSFRIWIFTNSLALFLARISFSLYIVHGSVLHVLGYNIPSWIWAVFGKDSFLGYGVGLVGGWLISLVICLMVADVFQREVEMRCVTFTKWLEAKVLRSEH